MADNPSVKLYHDKTLAFCEAFTFIMVNFTRLLVRGQTYPKMEFTNQTQVVYAVDEDKKQVVGAILFFINPDLTAGTCHTSVDPDYQGQGLQTKMFAMVEKILRAAGAKVISTGAWVDNQGMQASLRASGRDIVVVRGTKVLTRKLAVNPSILKEIE
jgi:ribosomal protein S18 acetylase RimI-like enzyme